MKNTMKTYIEIDGDTADRIVVCSLKDSLDTLRRGIALLRRKRKLDEWEQRELDEQLADMDFLKRTLEYYGGKE